MNLNEAYKLLVPGATIAHVNTKTEMIGGVVIHRFADGMMVAQKIGGLERYRGTTLDEIEAKSHGTFLSNWDMLSNNWIVVPDNDLVK